MALKTLLLADDSPTIRRVVELSLLETGFRVESAATGEEAWLRFSRGGIDLVLADVVMPEPSGYELARRVKDSGHPVPVLLLVGTFEPMDERRLRECGAAGLLIKPFESSVLLQKVEELLERAGAPVGTAPATGEGPPEEIESALAEADQEVGVSLGPQTMEQIVRAVVDRLSEKVVRQLAEEILPGVAERVVRERIAEIEREP